MANQNSQVRFDTREIAVIFSLFIFVSLLMFTVGILVGKGLAQARYEGTTASAPLTSEGEHGVDRAPTALNHEAVEPAHAPAAKSTSVSTDNHAHETAKADPSPASHSAPKEESGHGGEAPTAHTESTGHGTTLAHAEKEEPAHGEAVSSAEATLELVPKKPKSNDVKAGLQDFPETKETAGLFKNPKTRDIFEADPKAKNHAVAKAMVEKDFTKRSVASVGSRIPTSLPEGKYTVQVGSYSDQKEAGERVESLKKMGFPFAYFSANELKERNEIWYRVWLGYYSDYDSAKTSGDILQARGEVKNFLVRKLPSDSAKN